MKTRYRHQVPGASSPEHFPLLGRNSALFADRECNQHAAIRVVFQRAQHALPQAQPQAIHLIHKACRIFRQFRVYALDADVTRCANVALQRPRFKVKPVRIHRSMRALQAHGKLPAFPRHQCGWRFFYTCFAIRLVIPGERDAGWDHRRFAVNVQQDFFNIELEPRPAFSQLRQTRDCTDDFDILDF